MLHRQALLSDTLGTTQKKNVVLHLPMAIPMVWLKFTVFTGASETNAAQKAVNNWVNSEGHFQTMIDARGDCMGVGVARYDGITYCYLFIGNPRYP